MNIRSAIALAVLSAAPLFSQVGGFQNLAVAAPSPPQVNTNAGTITVTGPAGVGRYFYWIMAHYPIGTANNVTTSISTTKGPNTLSAGNYITVSWPSTGATTYDVLRTSAANVVPSGTCVCAVATGVTGTSQVDNGAALTSYTLSANAPPAVGNITMNNLTTAAPQIIFDTPIVVPSCIGCGGGGGGTGTVTSVACGTFTASWLTCTFGGSPTVTPVLALSPTTGQTSHQVIGTCGTGTTFGPCALVPGDLPTATSSALGIVKPDNSTITISGGVISSVGSSSSFTAPYTNPATITTTQAIAYRANVLFYAGVNPNYPSTATDSTVGFNQALADCGVIFDTLTIPYGTYLLGDQTFWGSPSCNVIVEAGVQLQGGLPTPGGSHFITYQQSRPIIPFPVFSTGPFSGAHVLGTAPSGAWMISSANDLASPTQGIGGGTAQAQTFNLNPAITAYLQGATYCWAPSVANTAAAPTLAINGLTATTITLQNGVALLANDIIQAVPACVKYFNSAFQLQNPQASHLGNGASGHSIAFSTTPAFVCTYSTGGTVDDFVVGQLSNSIVSSTLTNCTTGQYLNFLFQQAASGGPYTVAMPTGFDTCNVSTQASGANTCTYWWDGTSGHSINPVTQTAVQSLSGKTLVSPSIGTTPITETYTVGTGGVIQSTLVMLDTSNPSEVITSTNSGFGIAQATVAATGTVQVARLGISLCITDTGGSTAGHLVIGGSGTFYYCADSGTTSRSLISLSTRVIGHFLTTVTAGNPALVELDEDSYGTGFVQMSLASGAPTYTAGTNVSSCAQASSYTNSNSRGEITIAGGTATTGTVCTVNFSATLSAAPGLCMVTQEGGATLFGIGHGVPATTGFTITSAVSVASSTFNVDYYCLP